MIKRQKIIISILVSIFILILLGYQFCYNTVYKYCTVEAGYTIQLKDFDKGGVGSISLVSSKLPDTSKIGDYEVCIKKGLFSHNCVVTIQDTIAPTATGIELTVGNNQNIEASDCVKDVKDETNITYEFINSIDYTKSKVQEIKVKLTDEAGNGCEVSSFITVIQDDMPPVITGPNVIQVEKGKTITYLEAISTSDNSGQEVDLEIDNSKVNVNVVGNYEVTITATDKAGNQTQKVIQIEVIAGEMTDREKETAIIDKSKEILSQIINDSMTSYQKVEAIWTYVNKSISYVHSNKNTDWVSRAYEGLFEKKGDCYTYQQTSNALLTQAGIKNMNIYRRPSDDPHAWNLVDIGEGWYHYDAVKKIQTEYIIMWTDQQAMEFSARDDGTYDYDPSKYPTIQ